MLSHFPVLVSSVLEFSPPTHWLPSPQVLSQTCATHMQEPIPQAWRHAFTHMGIPALDLQVTLLSTRVGLLALERGLRFFHHELRGRIPMPESLQPEQPVWDHSTIPVWQDGILTEPKYFSFFLDTPISPYNPNYRQKWRTHELLHGLVGFFWHPQMTRFEAYLGMRLDELLPVVHWYGLDEMFRPRCPKHLGKPMYRELCPTCESMARPYDTHSGSWIETEMQRAEMWATQAWQHFSDEWATCLYELETGQRTETPHPHLNASSDAVGYLYSHWPRITAWSFGSWVERFLHQGFDYFDTLPAFMKHIAHTAQRMVSGDIVFAPQTTQRLQIRRMLQDLGYRCFLALEWLEENSRAAERAEAILLPLLDQAAHCCHQLLSEPSATQTGYELFHQIVETFHTEIQSRKLVPSQVSEPFLMLGYPWNPPDSETEPPGNLLSWQAMLSQTETFLREGISSAAVQSWEIIETRQLNPRLREFASSEIFLESGRLLSRYARWYATQPDRDMALSEWLRFEAWTQEDPLQDEEAECFAVLPEDPYAILSQSGRIRLHTTFRQASWSHTLIAHVLETSIEHESGEVAAIYHNHELRLLLLDQAMLQILNPLRLALPTTTWLQPHQHETLQILMEHAVVVWFPVPRKL